MEANEFYNLSISPLVSSSFSLEWSEDNHISLITQRGVHVFELVPHPMCIYPTLKFWRTFIYPSEFWPAENFQAVVNDDLWNMEREKMYELLLQEAITPKIEERTTMNPRIVKVSWSPKKLANPSKCLLAILTSTGSVEILYKLGKDWLSVWNLSDRWAKMVQIDSGIDPMNLEEKSFAETSWPEHIKRFIGTSFDWSPIFRDSNDAIFANLVVAFRSSDLTIFRIKRIADLSQTQEPVLVFKKSMNSFVKITQLMWISLEETKKIHLLLMGFADGKIQGLIVDESSGEFRDGKIFKYEDRADRMAITSLKFVKMENGHFRIFASKNSCLVALTLDANGECLERRYLRLEGFSITGLLVIDGNRGIATTQDARMYVIEIGESKKITCELVKHDLKSTKVQYLGMAKSPNGAIFLNITSPDTMYDHLISREPSVLQIFNLKDESLNPWKTINRKIESGISLNEYWDCVESLRINGAKAANPTEVLPKISNNFDSLKIHELRIVMWMTMIIQILEKKQLLKGVDKIVGEISEARPLIFLLSAANHLARISMRKDLNEDEKRCVSFLRMYMEIYVAGNDGKLNDLEAEVVEALRLTSKFATIETEICNLCGDVLTELPWIVDRCPSGHKLPRCSLSLLQITSIEYRSCPVCQRLFHPSLDLIYDEIRCLYCDVPAIYDDRVKSLDLDDDYRGKFVNLSKKPASYLQQAETKLASDFDYNERIKKRNIHPHTFAVIVNRDQDDDSLITETWQEF